ncbi:MAG: hypothetical protein PHH08_00685 [Candidatus ainarchaeum sp.]|nr:hypothetical protein [Candidatus ainarchaeum sp.]
MVLRKKARVYARRLRRKIRPAGLTDDRDLLAFIHKSIVFGESLLSKMRSGEIKGKVIFLGRGMHPLFEAVSALNNAEGLVPRRRIRYFIFPRMYPARPFYNPGEAVANLKRLKIVDGKTKDFTIVDYTFGGHTLQDFEKELKRAEPNSKTRIVTQQNNPFGAANSAEAIFLSDRYISKPTGLSRQARSKTRTVEPSSGGLVGPRTKYLRLQAEIKYAIEERMQKAKK